MCLFRSLCSATGIRACGLGMLDPQKEAAPHPIHAVGTRVHWGIKQSWHPRMPIQRSVDRHIRPRSIERIPSFGKTRLGLWSEPQHPECGIVGAHVTRCAWA